MSQVLEHIVDPASTVAKVKTHLAIGGVFACAVPNFRSFSVRILGTRDNSCLWVPEHVNYFTLSGLTTLLRREGLEVVGMNQVTRIRYDALGRRLPGFPLPRLVSSFVKYGQRPVARVAHLFGAGLYLNIYATRAA
jgi:hypothetical protein